MAARVKYGVTPGGREYKAERSPTAKVTRVYDKKSFTGKETYPGVGDGKPMKYKVSASHVNKDKNGKTTGYYGNFKTKTIKKGQTKKA